MERPYVEWLSVKNYGCIQDATLHLSPLHALIGPNDSGKTTFLNALGTLAVNARAAAETWDREKLTRLLHASQARGASALEATSSDGKAFPLQVADGNLSIPVVVLNALRGTQLLRLDPDALRIPCQLIPQGQPVRFQDERGTGLPAIYDALVSREIHAFLNLNREISTLFPDVESISLVNQSAHQKGIGVKLRDGNFVSANFMSEGLLYYLAFAALRHIEPTSLLLIEEPENGLHPARIAEVMKVLREISKTTQIVIATHSPLVINELEPHEVSVVTRTREAGTKAVLMKDTPNFEERSKVYALGELWLSYANGIDEAPLLTGGPRP